MTRTKRCRVPPRSNCPEPSEAGQIDTNPQPKAGLKRLATPRGQLSFVRLPDFFNRIGAKRTLTKIGSWVVHGKDHSGSFDRCQWKQLVRIGVRHALC
jgi:hypothetical protein